MTRSEKGSRFSFSVSFFASLPLSPRLESSSTNVIMVCEALFKNIESRIDPDGPEEVLIDGEVESRLLWLLEPSFVEAIVDKIESEGGNWISLSFISIGSV